MPDLPSPALPHHVKDITGQRFRRLTAIRFVRMDKHKAVWQFFCDCGNSHEARAADVKSGRTQSCGCWNRETASNRATHGLTRKGKTPPPIYRSWYAMKTRCGNPNQKDWNNYGGRGITVCERWQKFENFLQDMGPTWKPGLSIDRIDPNGNYCKQNCRWATKVEQGRNQRRWKK